MRTLAALVLGIVIGSYRPAHGGLDGIKHAVMLGMMDAAYHQGEGDGYATGLAECRERARRSTVHSAPKARRVPVPAH